MRCLALPQKFSGRSAKDSSLLYSKETNTSSRGHINLDDPVDTRTARTANLRRGALPPVDLFAVCFFRAMYYSPTVQDRTNTIEGSRSITLAKQRRKMPKEVRHTKRQKDDTGKENSPPCCTVGRRWFCGQFETPKERESCTVLAC